MTYMYFAGVLLVVAGVGMKSIPNALIVGGTILLVSFAIASFSPRAKK